MAAHVRKREQDFKDEKIHSPLPIANFLKDWLAKHILETDQKYAPFVKAKGVVLPSRHRDGMTEGTLPLACIGSPWPMGWVGPSG